MLSRHEIEYLRDIVKELYISQKATLRIVSRLQDYIIKSYEREDE